MTEIFKWFANSANVAFATFMVSVVALIFSGIALFRTKETDKRLLEIEEQRESERKTVALKAQLRCHIEKAKANSFQLVFENSGECAARNIKVKINGEQFEKHCSYVSNSPIPNIIGPQSKAEVILALCGRCFPPFEVDILWKDDSNEKGRYETTLTA